ncbi:serine/threonine-protein kinase [Myceligenerans pegani]|uniref:non-specific serine/threonine protein kinase n=1 Tax=Myceligenerans pegani TaxID=2776917 RepID=A0ABR9MUY1_9MICO|nr:serine/threonine-protein kinase [Myceligenerans sp. TRM 65318]MBE1875192.1 serine/threonine protein kinase [Myceligenerans sp. TRM 65318]MBE3017463.1 serine/threonine protein kinase [Myceligenerans sp. TRM 65318]
MGAEGAVEGAEQRTDTGTVSVRDRAAGSVVGGYTVTGRIGSGAMGTVYSATDDGGNAVALKLLTPGRDEAGARERLRREARALQRLKHPAVATVLDVELDATDAFIVTELVEGPTLEEEVDARGPLDPRDLYELADQLADALEAVHAAGVVHRDLTPSNVLISPTGPVLIDFGLAHAPGDARATRTGFVMGTPGYLAPELLDGGEPVPNTDWWSWAAVLAFAATGRSPFGVRPLELVLRRSREGDADLTGLEPRTSRALAAALRPTPAERWGPTEVARSLRAASEAFVAAARAADPEVPADDIGDRRTQVMEGPTTVVEPITPKLEPVTAVVEPAAAGQDTAPMRANGGGGAGGLGAGPSGHGRSVRSHPVGAVHGASPGAGGPGGHPGGHGVAPPAAVQPGPIPVPVAGRMGRYPARTGTVTAVGGALVALAATRPGWALAAFVVLCVLCRASGAAANEMWNWRMRHGTVTGGKGRAVLLMPWYLVRSVFGVLPALLIGSAVGAIVALGGFWLFAPGRVIVLPLEDLASRAVGGTNDPIVDTWVLAVAMLVTMLLTWWGPVAQLTREGSRALLSTVAPGWVGAGLLVVLSLAVVGLGAAAIVADPLVVDWWPLAERPDVR